MRIPENRTDRHALYRNLIRECEVSREDRRSKFRERRDFYLTGTDTGEGSRYNKIKEHVANSSSFLYEPSSVRFGIALPTNVGDDWTEEEEVAREDLHHLWHDSDAGLVFDSAVTWAHVMDTAVLKVIVDENEPRLMLVSDPSDIGVRDEDRDTWRRQEAIVHWYRTDLDRFRRMIFGLPEQKQNELYDAAESYSVPGYQAHGDMLPPTVSRIILASASPTMIGSVSAPADGQRAIARVKTKLIELAELWVWDDALKNYRVVTNFLPTEDILWDPENPLLKGEHPFHGLCLTIGGTPGYLWGDAPIGDLMKLQAWRELKMDQLDLRDELTLNPPIVFEGVGNLDGERAKTFRHPGGNVTLAQPNSKATPMIPPPLPDPFAFVDKIDGMFNRQGGLPAHVTGDNQANTRSGDQAMTQAMLGAGPTMKRAMLVEDCLEGVATSMWRLHRRVEERTLRTHTGREFLLSQMPATAVARVWAHSASPVYAQKIIQKAILAVDRKAMTPERLLDYLDLPLTENLKAEARKLGEAQAQKSDKVLEFKQKEADAKLISAEAKRDKA